MIKSDFKIILITIIWTFAEIYILGFISPNISPLISGLSAFVLSSTNFLAFFYIAKNVQNKKFIENIKLLKIKLDAKAIYLLVKEKSLFLKR